MAEVPVSNKDLDEVIYKVARDFIEDKAINNKIENVDEKLTQEVIQDVIFIVESYMAHINELMSQTKLITAETSKIDLE